VGIGKVNRHVYHDIQATCRIRRQHRAWELWVAVLLIALLGICSPVLAEDRAIHRYAAHGNIEEVNRLITAHPIMVNKQDASGATPLISATSNSEAGMVAFLLSKGADPNIANNGGAAPLHYASSALRANTRMADLLRQHGAIIYVRNRDGGTVLHSAAGAAVPAMIRYWLDQGMGVHVTDNYGRQPIHYIARAMWKVPEAVEALLAAGADINARANKGKTPLQLATERRNSRAIEALKARGAK